MGRRTEGTKRGPGSSEAHQQSSGCLTEPSATLLSEVWRYVEMRAQHGHETAKPHTCNIYDHQKSLGADF